jgi:hypothetical protein
MATDAIRTDQEQSEVIVGSRKQASNGHVKAQHVL